MRRTQKPPPRPVMGPCAVGPVPSPRGMLISPFAHTSPTPLLSAAKPAPMLPPFPRSGPTTRLHEARLRESTTKVGSQHIVHLAGYVRDDLDPCLRYGLRQGLRHRSAEHHSCSQISYSPRLSCGGFIPKRDFLPRDFSFSIHLHDQQHPCEVERRGDLVAPHWNGEGCLHGLPYRRLRANRRPLHCDMQNLLKERRLWVV